MPNIWPINIVVSENEIFKDLISKVCELFMAMHQTAGIHKLFVQDQMRIIPVKFG
jgi:hypothetical protein